MADLNKQARDAIDNIIADGQLLHDIVNGANNATVAVNDGKLQVDTASKAIKELKSLRNFKVIDNTTNGGKISSYDLTAQRPHILRVVDDNTMDIKLPSATDGDEIVLWFGKWDYDKTWVLKGKVHYSTTTYTDFTFSKATYKNTVQLLQYDGANAVWNLYTASEDAVGSGGSGGSGVTVDTALNIASSNPVTNKAITTALNGKVGNAILDNTGKVKTTSIAEFKGVRDYSKIETDRSKLSSPQDITRTKSNNKFKVVAKTHLKGSNQRIDITGDNFLDVENDIYGLSKNECLFSDLLTNIPFGGTGNQVRFDKAKTLIYNIDFYEDVCITNFRYKNPHVSTIYDTSKAINYPSKFDFNVYSSSADLDAGTNPTKTISHNGSKIPEQVFNFDFGNNLKGRYIGIKVTSYTDNADECIFTPYGMDFGLLNPILEQDTYYPIEKLAPDLIDDTGKVYLEKVHLLTADNTYYAGLENVSNDLGTNTQVNKTAIDKDTTANFEGSFKDKKIKIEYFATQVRSHNTHNDDIRFILSKSESWVIYNTDPNDEQILTWHFDLGSEKHLLFWRFYLQTSNMSAKLEKLDSYKGKVIETIADTNLGSSRFGGYLNIKPTTVRYIKMVIRGSTYTSNDYQIFHTSPPYFLDETIALSSSLNEKVDKVSGKGLSANDFTNALKTKLDSIEDVADITPVIINNAYSTQTLAINKTYRITFETDANKTINLPSTTNLVDGDKFIVYFSQWNYQSRVINLSGRYQNASGGSWGYSNFGNTIIEVKYEKSSDSFQFAYVLKPVSGSSVTVDNALSTSSNNPVANKAVTTAINNKVDKVSGKVLTSNDYTNAEKTKLSGIEAGAEKNEPQIVKTTATWSSKANSPATVQKLKTGDIINWHGDTYWITKDGNLIEKSPDEITSIADLHKDYQPISKDLTKTYTTARSIGVGEIFKYNNQWWVAIAESTNYPPRLGGDNKWEHYMPKVVDEGLDLKADKTDLEKEAVTNYHQVSKIAGFDTTASDINAYVTSIGTNIKNGKFAVGLNVAKQLWHIETNSTGTVTLKTKITDYFQGLEIADNSDSSKRKDWDGSKWVVVSSTGGGSGSVTVDTAFNETSKNPVENQVVTKEFHKIERKIPKLLRNKPHYEWFNDITFVGDSDLSMHGINEYSGSIQYITTKTVNTANDEFRIGDLHNGYKEDIAGQNKAKVTLEYQLIFSSDVVDFVHLSVSGNYVYGRTGGNDSGTVKFTARFYDKADNVQTIKKITSKRYRYGMDDWTVARINLELEVPLVSSVIDDSWTIGYRWLSFDNGFEIKPDNFAMCINQYAGFLDTTQFNLTGRILPFLSDVQLLEITKTTDIDISDVIRIRFKLTAGGASGANGGSTSDTGTGGNGGEGLKGYIEVSDIIKEYNTTKYIRISECTVSGGVVTITDTSNSTFTRAMAGSSNTSNCTGGNHLCIQFLASDKSVIDTIVVLSGGTPGNRTHGGLEGNSWGIPARQTFYFDTYPNHQMDKFKTLTIYSQWTGNMGSDGLSTNRGTRAQGGGSIFGGGDCNTSATYTLPRNGDNAQTPGTGGAGGTYGKNSSKGQNGGLPYGKVEVHKIVG